MGIQNATARRLISVAPMLVGALLGAVLVVEIDLVLPFSIAVVLLATSALIAHRLSAGKPAWA
jgi:hypothetical protein